MFPFWDSRREDKILVRMLASTTRILSPLNFLPNQIQICYYRSQLFALCHTFKTCVCHLYAKIKPCTRRRNSNIYFVFSALILDQLQFVRLYRVSVESHHQQKAETDVSHLISVPPGFCWTFPIAYSKAKAKCNDDSSSCWTPFWIWKIRDKCLPIQALRYVSLNHILNE
jgi:hypothetical protein